jgi:predicted phage terminase large subunit-like protein
MTDTDTLERPVIADIDYHNDPPLPLTPEEKIEYANLTRRFLTIPYCPWTPNAGPQEQFLLDFGRDALYGGAVGGAKSVALMMAASQFLDVPGYDALLIRKHYTDLVRPGALMDLAEDWWAGKPGVKFNRSEHQYEFDCPGGGKSRVTFGAMDTENDRLKYQGGRYHFVGYDELTQFKERDFVYLFSRQRRTTTGPTATIPMRMRSTSNPGGPGHEWVYKRYIAHWQRWRTGLTLDKPKRNFHPALLSDNPQLDYDDYVQSLMELDPITRAQLLRGDWNIRPDGRMFSREWFKPIHRHDVPGDCHWVRFWDMAATDQVAGLDPDYTVGALVGRTPDNQFYIADIRRWRHGPKDNDRFTRITAEHDGNNVTQAMEQEPGSGGKIAIHHYRTTSFASVGLRAIPSSGKSRGRTTTLTAGRKTPIPKILAAGPLASHADAGLVHVVVDGTWEVDDFLSEAEIFPDGEHDDQIDAVSGAVNLLVKIQNFALDLNGGTSLTKPNEWKPAPITNFPSTNGTGLIHGERIDEVRDQVEERQREREMERLIADAFEV